MSLPFFWPWIIKSYDSGWNESIGGPLLDWRAFSHLSGSLLHRVHLLLHFLHIATLCSPAERWLFCRLCSLVGRSHFFWNAENPPFFCLCRLMSHLKNSWHGSLLSLRVLNGTDTHGSGVKTWRATLAAINEHFDWFCSPFHPPLTSILFGHHLTHWFLSWKRINFTFDFVLR